MKRTAPAREAALASHASKSIRLSNPQRALLDEALRRSEDLRDEVETSMTSFGRWLLGEVFAGDASGALDERVDNPVWRELVRRAGGPTLKVSRRILYVALHLAARDKRITDQAWRGLDAGRKELLLPLGRDDRLRDGAKHVSKLNLTQARTRQYVTEQLKAEGKPRQVRLTVPRIVKQVQTLRASLGTAAALNKAAEVAAKAKPRDLAKAVAEVEKLHEGLAQLLKALRGKR